MRTLNPGAGRQLLHKCPFPGCERQVATQLLMCPKHWKLVPKSIQVKVYRAWQARKNAPGDPDVVESHINICAEAITEAVKANGGGECRE